MEEQKQEGERGGMGGRVEGWGGEGGAVMQQAAARTPVHGSLPAHSKSTHSAFWHSELRAMWMIYKYHFLIR